jgi:hypothetical protein
MRQGDKEYEYYSKNMLGTIYDDGMWINYYYQRDYEHEKKPDVINPAYKVLRVNKNDHLLETCIHYGLHNFVERIDMGIIGSTIEEKRKFIGAVMECEKVDTRYGPFTFLTDLK